jgi:hypothetical protein
MYCRLTLFKMGSATRAGSLAFIEETIKPRLRAIGVTQAWWIEGADDEWTLVALYPTRAAAEAGLAQADRNLQDAAAASVLRMSTVQRREGEVVATL